MGSVTCEIVVLLLLLTVLYVVQSYHIKKIPSVIVQLKQLPRLRMEGIAPAVTCSSNGIFRHPLAAYCMHSHNTEYQSSESTKLSLVADEHLANVVESKPATNSQDLLAKYGIAYLLTSISFSIASYALCYTLVFNGVDVAALLERFGMRSSKMASSAGTVAIAYACHKAASPLRFPPTVAMTPVVASWMDRLPSLWRSIGSKDQGR